MSYLIESPQKVQVELEWKNKTRRASQTVISLRSVTKKGLLSSGAIFILTRDVVFLFFGLAEVAHFAKSSEDERFLP